VDNKEKKSGLTPQSIYNYVMGVVWTALGIVFLFHKELKIPLGERLDDDPVLVTIFGAAAMLYGAFRLYRGYSKR